MSLTIAEIREQELQRVLEGVPPLRRLSDREFKDVDLAAYGVIELLGGMGDAKLIWDRNNLDEVEAARATYERLKGRGFAAFRSNPKSGEAGARLDTFDPTAEAMIMTPAQAGGW